MFTAGIWSIDRRSIVPTVNLFCVFLVYPHMQLYKEEEGVKRGQQRELWNYIFFHFDFHVENSGKSKQLFSLRL